MEPEQIPQAIVFTVVFAAVALGLWYWGVRWNKLAFKQIAVMTAMAPVIMLAIQVFGPYLAEIDYRVNADGPTAQQASTVTTVQLNVTDTELNHRFELVPRIGGDNPPRQAVHLKYSLRSPRGAILVQGEGDLAPAKWEWYRWFNRSEPTRWQPLRGQFKTREEGQHALMIYIPQPVRRVEIFVRETRK
jgi:hypothetical protein